MIAEILAKNPKYLIFDEPTTMIDSIGKEKIYKIIKNLKQQGYTIICITNLADEILLADRTLVLEQGKIALEIKREELVEKAEELRKYEIKLPTILEILNRILFKKDQEKPQKTFTKTISGPNAVIQRGLLALGNLPDIAYFSLNACIKTLR